MYFLGVTTGASSIMKVFPLWMKELGRPEVRLEGIDLALQDSFENYRTVVAHIKRDPLSVGALVTSHKIGVFEAARDLFDRLDQYALTCGEVSCIAKSGGRLEGYAKDPLTAGMSLRSLLGNGYFGRTGGEVLCLGAGGAATAITLHFIQQRSAAARPSRMTVVDRSEGRLHHLRSMITSLAPTIAFEFRANAVPEVNDELMAALPPGSLVINATGMGKDLPGSPVTHRGVFPMNGVAWELNYRGELAFLHHALAQHQSRKLVVQDGWLYFLHGWTAIIAEVLKTRIDAERFEKLSRIAGAKRVAAPE